MSKAQLKISCRFYRITDLGILHLYFSSNNQSSKIYTPLDKVVVLGTQSTRKLGLLFLDFSTILIDFTSHSQNTTRVKNLFTGSPLEVFKSSHLCPCLPLPWNRRQRRARRREERRDRQTSGGKTAIGLTRGRWVAEDWPGVLPASGDGGPVVARPRVLEFQRGQGRDKPMCCMGSFTRV
jgi:hypothetical protein